MTAFDFSAAETEFVHDIPLRERAAAAYQFRLTQEHHELLLVAQEVIHEILGETNGTEVAFGSRSVELNIDNIRFKVFVDDEGDRQLSMMVAKNAWKVITEIEDVGAMLASKPCYAIDPPDVVPEPEPKNFGLGNRS